MFHPPGDVAQAQQLEAARNTSAISWPLGRTIATRSPRPMPSDRSWPARRSIAACSPAKVREVPCGAVMATACVSASRISSRIVSIFVSHQIGFEQ